MTHAAEVHRLHERFQHLQLIRSRNEISQQFLVEFRGRLQEVCEACWFFRNDSVFFEVLDADFGLRVECGSALKENLLVRFRTRYIFS